MFGSSIPCTYHILHSYVVRGVPNNKLNSSAVQSMATKGDEITLYIMAEPLLWPCENSQLYYPLVLFCEKLDVKNIQCRVM